uniref:uncharacterized protein LOC120346660 n=1 Tax=Styela clava TaxID=7725 RepID=UPI001939D061|nr:uncharacterized protein LOC120346660 [Styela clava]
MDKSTLAGNMSGRIGVFNTATEGSGFLPVNEQNYATAIPISTNDCDAWGIPSRIALQVLVLLMLILNIAAAVVIFGVPINIRGRHVAFLFICVRVLNVLDLYQCSVIFFFPIGMPKDCQNPNVFYCNLSGFCFATGTIVSPLVAIVMALDRLFAVFFHVRYKARPQTKMKCGILAGIIGIYVFYFTLPFYTNFGKYLAVSWLSLCSFEWGIEYRMFNLVLFLTTTILTLILMAANIAIVVKVRRRKREFEKLKASSQNTTQHRGIKMTKFSPVRSGMKLWKSKSVNDLSLSSDRVSRSPRSLHERRGKFLSPLRIFFSSTASSPTKERHIDADHKQGDDEQGASQTITNYNLEKTKDENLDVLTVPHSFSPTLPSPLTHDSALLFPPSPASSRRSTNEFRPQSPLVTGDNEIHSTLRIVSRPPITRSMSHGIKRLSSTDSILDAKDQQMSTFGYRTVDPDNLRKKALGNTNLKKRTASSEPFLDRSFNSGTNEERLKSTSSNSIFSNFVGSRLMSWRQRASRPKGIRRNVSRITKMTTAICTLFAILYVPFLVRKLVQIIPQDYYTVHVPYAVEIITLFGPLLSPLCNPILYVFFNPHYRENCKRLYRKFTKTTQVSRDIAEISSTQSRFKSFRKKKRVKNHIPINVSESENMGIKGEFKHGNDEVFLSTGHIQHEDGVFVSDASNSDSGCSMRMKDEYGRKQSLRQMHLRRIQNLQYRRTKSNDYLN